VYSLNSVYDDTLPSVYDDIQCSLEENKSLLIVLSYYCIDNDHDEDADYDDDEMMMIMMI
jgi:hypothetical protein